MSGFLYDNTYSKTREGAKSFSREAMFQEYNQDHVPVGLIGGTNTVGSMTVDQSRKGVKYPTVQAAIDDITNSMVIPVDGILETTEDLNPAGNSSIERLTITGTATDDHIFLYGYKIPVAVNDVNDQVTTKVINFINTNLVANDEIVKSVTSITTNVFEVEFLDNRSHQPTNYNINGISINGEITVNARGGFGTWTKLGQYEKFTGVTVYAWKRTS